MNYAIGNSMEESQNVKIGKLETRSVEHNKRLDKIDIILDKVKNRPPVWASLTIAVLLAVIGYLANGSL